MANRRSMSAAPRRGRRSFRDGGRTAGADSVRVWLLGAVLVGAAGGTASLATTPQARTALAERIRPLAVGMGLVRAREPQEGDYWQGCNETRAAGTAPIYASEPGYREDMDGDGDGVACEPHR